MNVQQLIEKLNQLPKDMEVVITDGYEGLFYQGDFSIEVYKDENGKEFVDIGIGGLRVDY